MSSAIDRRVFLTGALSTTVAGKVLAKQMSEVNFQARYQELLDRFQKQHPGVVRDFRIVTIGGNMRPWIDTGMDVTMGDLLTILSRGEVFLSRTTRLSLLPRVILWTRIGDGNLFRPGTDTSSFRAQDTGRFRLATLQGRWATPQGDPSNPAAYDRVEGALDVLIIRWHNADAIKGITLLVEFAAQDTLIAEEHKRLQTPLTLPHGFEELWYVGGGANFNRTSFDNEPAIAVRSQLNGGIIRFPFDIPIRGDVWLEWDWRVNQLPSVRSEDSIPFHQYVSIATEFDDGQDLTWYWSAALDKENHYACPLPSWPGETHVVVRTGANDQGQWVSERRNVQADSNAALKKQPSRIVGIWLIALTAFGERPASVDFRRITVVDGDGRGNDKKHRIFPA